LRPNSVKEDIFWRPHFVKEDRHLRQILDQEDRFFRPIFDKVPCGLQGRAKFRHGPDAWMLEILKKQWNASKVK